MHIVGTNDKPTNLTWWDRKVEIRGNKKRKENSFQPFATTQCKGNLDSVKGKHKTLIVASAL